MRSLKTFFCVILIAPWAFPAQALENSYPTTAHEQARAFAVCTGQLSALMEYQWMTDGPASEQTEARRALFIALLDAVLPDAEGVGGRTVLSWRLEAKLAFARLLDSADRATDARLGQLAARTAEAQIAQCDRMVLG